MFQVICGYFKKLLAAMFVAAQKEAGDDNRLALQSLLCRQMLRDCYLGCYVLIATFFCNWIFDVCVFGSHNLGLLLAIGRVRRAIGGGWLLQVKGVTCVENQSLFSVKGNMDKKSHMSKCSLIFQRNKKIFCFEIPDNFAVVSVWLISIASDSFV